MRSSCVLLPAGSCWADLSSALHAGFLSPASRGALLTALMFTYLLLAVAAGFAAVWLYGMIMRTYDGWKVCLLCGVPEFDAVLLAALLGCLQPCLVAI